VTYPAPYRHSPEYLPVGRSRDQSLADILERVLDKGIVIAGDVQVNLLDIELLTLKVRLLIASADTAKNMGIDWWEHDPFLSRNAAELARENDDLRRRLDRLERMLAGDHPDTGDEQGRREGDHDGRPDVESGRGAER
jgi:hypothetical protein